MKDENDLLKSNAQSDSIALAALTQAYYEQTEALLKCEDGLKLSDELADTVQKLYTIEIGVSNKKDKEIRRQKVIKWVAIVLAGLLAVHDVIE
jgi:hypothetical protein